jgi:hypothetical protein
MYKALAALLRKGAALRPACRGNYFGVVGCLEQHKPLEIQSCAMGAILEAFTGTIRFSRAAQHELFAAYPILEAQLPREVWPEKLRQAWDSQKRISRRNLAQMIIYLNDSMEWSREAIADWLDGLEPLMISYCVDRMAVLSGVMPDVIEIVVKVGPRPFDIPEGVPASAYATVQK